MSDQSTTTTTQNVKQPSLKIGSRVRCTDDGVEGRITWANAVSVKIGWDDGEQITWRRDSLAGRPLEILGAADTGATDQLGATVEVAPSEQATASETTAPARRLFAGVVVSSGDPHHYRAVPLDRTLSLCRDEELAQRLARGPGTPNCLLLKLLGQLLVMVCPCATLLRALSRFRGFW